MVNCIYSLKLIESIQLLILYLSNEAFSSTCAVNSLHVSLKSEGFLYFTFEFAYAKSERSIGHIRSCERFFSFFLIHIIIHIIIHIVNGTTSFF
jgi:hypothetical protein